MGHRRQWPGCAYGPPGPAFIDNQITYPPDLQYAVAVGGTTLHVNNGTNQYNSEVWWSTDDGSNAACKRADGNGCGGFGISTLVPQPTWQVPYSSTPMRSVPDVVAYAWPGVNIVVRGTQTPYNGNGTSYATPTWAAGLALINQARMAIGQGQVALLGPQLYNLANTGGFHPASSFLPLPRVPGGANDFTHLGLGSPNWGGLAAELAPTPTDLPATATVRALTPTATRTATPTATDLPATATIRALTPTATATDQPATATIRALTATRPICRPPRRSARSRRPPRTCRPRRPCGR